MLSQIIKFSDAHWSKAILFSIVTCLFVTISFSPSIYIDEYWIASIADTSFGSDVIINTPLRNFATGYMNIQPFYLFVSGLVIKLFGSSLVVIRILSAFGSILIALIIVKLINRFSGDISINKFSLLMSIFLTTPIIWRTAHINRPEPLVLLMILLAVYVNTISTRSKYRDIVVGVITTFPVFFYITSIVVAPLVLITWIYQIDQASNKSQVVGSIKYRLVGIYLGGILFFIIVGTPLEIFKYLTESNVSSVNVADKSFFSRIYSYFIFYLNYCFQNILWYALAFLLLLYYYFKRSFKINDQATYLFLLYLASIVSFSLVSRKSQNYLVYTEVLLMLVVLYIINNLWITSFVRRLAYLLLVLNVFFVIIYTAYFWDFDFSSGKRKINEVVRNDGVVLARIQYKAYFFENNSFLAFEDFSNLKKISGVVNGAEYLSMNNVEWIIFDHDSEEEYITSFREVLSRRYQLVHTFEDPYIGHRIYEDIPFEWNIVEIVKRFRERPLSKISIYKRL